MLWQQFDTRAVNEEAPYRRQALMLFAEERANVGRLFDHALDGLRGTEVSADAEAHAIKGIRRATRLLYKPSGDVERRWEDRFHSLIGETWTKGATHVIGAIKHNRASTPPAKKKVAPPPAHFSYDFHLSDPNVQQAIRARASKLAREVGSTTADAIDSALSIGMREGMSIRDIAGLVDKTAFGSGAGYRANIIARTESIGALNQGQYTAARDSNVIRGKEWLTQGDDRVRDAHAECEAAGMVALDEPFPAGLMFPGDPDADAEDVINCRCTLLYYDTMTEGPADDVAEEDGGERSSANVLASVG